ncbi:MAG: PorV/PorQ family protein [Syntrophothermus sp.]
MKKFTFLIITLLIISSAVNAQERKKLAQTGMKFLSVSLDARVSGLGDAGTSVNDVTAASMFYNPSTMASMTDMVSANVNVFTWIADIKYISSAVAFKPFDGDYGVFGLSFVSVDYGSFNSTIFAPTEAGFLDVGTYKPKALAFGLGYANQLSEKFSVGGNIKYVYQSLGSGVMNVALDKEDYKVNTLAFDFGILYHTGFKSLDFGMNVRNFSQELRYVEKQFQLPLTFEIGVSMNMTDLFNVNKDMYSFLLSVDASHPRDYSEQVSVGGEFIFMNTLALRAGYTYPTDEQEFTAGIGLKQRVLGYLLGVDYAYTPFGIFNDIHRISVNFAF